MSDQPVVIAVLDDETKMCKALGRLLRGHGYEVVLFDSGEAFLATQRPFDCVLLDLHMPGMSGLEVMKAVMHQDAHPPVIVITGRDEPGNREHLLSLGATAYLTKPADETTLLDAITLILPGAPRRH
ncbi:MAG TPA: response regulator [Terrimicrobiaceae bacterium]|nr:response regulator [Terrimicrobiaceae bacterium]